MLITQGYELAGRDAGDFHRACNPLAGLTPTVPNPIFNPLSWTDACEYPAAYTALRFCLQAH